MSFTSVDAKWAMFGEYRDFALIGKHAVATASGIHVRFVDLRSGRMRIERFMSHERGDGASCVAGHSEAPIFSLAERRANPRISVFSYPAIRRVSRCVDSEEARGYLCCSFSGTEYLLGQTTYPDFRLTLWRWRTGERLTSVCATAAVDLDRTILVCSSRLVARHEATNGTLSIFRVLACSNLVRLFPLEIVSRKVVSCSWSCNGSLLCCDELGNLWSVEFDEDGTHRVQTLVERRDNSGTRRNPMLLAHRDGALMIDRSLEEKVVRATLYRKASKEVDENWRVEWTTSLPDYPCHVSNDPHEERILFLVESGDLYEMTNRSKDRRFRVKLLTPNHANYSTIAPWSDRCFVALDRYDRLLLLDGSSGNLASSAKPLRLTHHGKIVRMIRHPSLPILATCSMGGNCIIVQEATSTALKVANCVHLQKEPLDRVKFSKEERILGVGASEIGRLFLLSVSSNRSKVASWLNLRQKLVDFLIRETDQDHVVQVWILVTESNDACAGKEILVYTCRLFGEFPEKEDHAITLSFQFDALQHGLTTSRDIVGVPYLSKQLQRIQLNQETADAVVLDDLSSLHQIGSISLDVHQDESLNRCLLITCGYDGLIVLRDWAKPQRVFAVFPAHHRAEGGGKCAILVGDAIVSLGKNGDLVASKLSRLFVPLPSLVVSIRLLASARKHEDTKNSAAMVNRISSNRVASTTEETAEEDYGGADTWAEARIRDRIMIEEKLALPARISILNDLNEVKRRVKELLDSNEKQPPYAKLPIAAFDLDQEARERKLAAIRAECESRAEKAKQLIARQDRTSCYLRERFLRPLLVPPRCIFSMFGRSKVANYPLLNVDSREANLRAWSRFSTKTRQPVSRSEKENEGEEEKDAEENQTNLLDFLLNLSAEQANLLDPCLSLGFVEIDEWNADTEQRERELKSQFNDRFETLRKAKREGMKTARKLADETRRCVDELWSTFQVDARSELIEPPRLNPEETSEEGLDSCSSSSDETANVADIVDDGKESSSEDGDFRREALQRMMDGLLELGLNDRAKRRVSKPDCLERKNPADYTEEEVRAIELYEKKLAAWRDDRQKYKSMLETEIARAKEEFQSVSSTFDEQLNDLGKEKLRVERTILSERLSRMQAVLADRRIDRARREIERANNEDLATATNEAHRLIDECKLFEAGVVTLRNRYEEARKRDNSLEVKFRAELIEPKRLASDHLIRQYRRRPRIAVARFGTSVAFLDELAERVINQRATSDVLPTEWLEYLRELDRLDARSNECRLESERWDTVCRLRRVKLESETKVRSCAIELAEAEQSLAFLRNACTMARAKIDRHRQEIHGLEKRLQDLMKDREVRLSLKTGQLQRQPEGCLRSDWEDAILLPRDELDRLKGTLAEVGQRKLDAMRRLANLREIVSVEEWRHERTKAAMEELQDRAKDLEAVKVSRILRECCDNYRNETTACKRQPVRIDESRTLSAWKTFENRLEMETRKWRRRNAALERRINESRAERDQLIEARDEPLRLRNVVFQRRNMRAIRRKATLSRRIRDNFEELSELEARLEMAKLRAFPTLTMEF